MSNLSLATVEGTGNFLPIGSVVPLIDEYPAVFEHEGLIYTQDDVPGRAIPDFDTKVPSVIKGYVRDPQYAFPIPGMNANAIGAGVSTSGVIVRAFLRNPASPQAGIIIERKGPNDTFYTNLGARLAQAQPTVVTVRTDNTGKWVIAIGNVLFRSKDDGLTWDFTYFVDEANAIREVEFGSSGVLMISAKANAGNSQAYLYTSKDLGETWEKPSGITGLTGFVNTTGTTWFAIQASSTTFVTSTDDGLTWANGGTLSFTPTPISNRTPMFFSNNRFYVMANGDKIYTGTSLSSMAVMAGNWWGIGTDSAGNCVATSSSDGVMHRSVNGAPFGSLASKGGYVAIAPAVIEHANGLYVDRTGAFITQADLVAGKGWTDLSLMKTNTTSAMGAASEDGIVIVPLNYNTYLRSTDNGKTFVPMRFNVPTTVNTGLQWGIGGVATDGFGNWAVQIGQTPTFFYSTDNGLTWISKQISGINNLVGGISGGGAAGTFLISNNVGDSALTQNGFTSVSVSTSGAGFGTQIQGSVYAGGFFYVFANQGSDTYTMRCINAITGVVTTSNSTALAVSGIIGILSYKGQLAVNTTLFNVSKSASSAAPAIQGTLSSAVWNLIDGIPNNAIVPAALGGGLQVDKIGSIVLYRNPSGYELYPLTLGIRDLNLPVNSYIKVA